MNISRFTRPELDKFRLLCNFTADEESLFEKRAKNETLELCAEEMNVSVSTIKRISHRMLEKIEKVM